MRRKTRKTHTVSSFGDLRVRGAPEQIVQRYENLADDAIAAGDNLTAQLYLNHAEHYRKET